MTPKQAFDVLRTAYQVEVERRRMKFEADEATLHNIQRVADYMTSASSPKFGLLLCGVPGNGKTTMLYALREAISFLSNAKMWETQKKLVVADARDIAGLAGDAERTGALRRTELLAIEDLGKEATEVVEYGNILNPMIDLVEYRYDMRLFTAATTNLTPPQIRKKYLDRVADRFNEMMEVIVFEHESYRK